MQGVRPDRGLGRVRMNVGESAPLGVEGDEVRVFFMSNVRKMADAAFTNMVAQLFHEAALADFKQDLNIWRHKIYRPRPVLVPGDGPILAYREWASQFYEPRVA